MELPESVNAIGEQLASGGKIEAAAELFEAYPVFAAELAQIFTRPWLAVDHASRLAADGDYFRADIGSRSIILTRDGGALHALRNACLHAGYRVCEEETGHGEQLICPYHGWYYALDGRLTDPYLRPDQPDRSRFRLPRYAMQIDRGLILVDLSSVAPEPPPATGPVDLGGIPESLAGAEVTARRRYPTTWNWKRLRQFVRSSPDLFCGGRCDGFVEIGPLSFVAVRGGEAATLVRLVPRFPGQSDVELVRIGPAGAPASGDDGADPIAEALREAGEHGAGAPLDRAFYEWYWSLMQPAAA